VRWSNSYRVNPAPGFIEPCLPTNAEVAPKGANWIHEIKHDGYRLLVRRRGGDVRIYTRRGADWTKRFPLIVSARKLKAQAFYIDGEGVVAEQNGLAVFDRIHSKQHDASVFLYAFDLLELDGDDLRGMPLIARKNKLKTLTRRSTLIRYNEHLEGEGRQIFESACKLGLEGIVSKRSDLPYVSGRSKTWLKIKNPNSAAMKRYEEGTF
jgi:bifunctional non-homologous end joining protein LigD